MPHLVDTNQDVRVTHRADPQRWLLVAHVVSGVQGHDARLVATMHVYGVPHLLTFNGDDFRRYAGITAVHPQDI
jgi:predicted nucleic acid-binding protein